MEELFNNSIIDDELELDSLDDDDFDDDDDDWPDIEPEDNCAAHIAIYGDSAYIVALHHLDYLSPEENCWISYTEPSRIEATMTYQEARAFLSFLGYRLICSLNGGGADTQLDDGLDEYIAAITKEYWCKGTPTNNYFRQFYPDGYPDDDSESTNPVTK